MISSKQSLSIVIPAFNAAETLSTTAKALYDQTREDWEAIIVDDGSTDCTAEIALELGRQDSRIRVERQPNGGASRARNTGIRSARSDRIMFLDADDWIAPTYVEKMIGALEAHPEASIAYCGYRRVSPEGVEMPIRWLPDLNSGAFEILAGECPGAIHCFVVPRDLVVAVAGFDEGLKTCEEWDLWQRLARMDPTFVEVREAMAFYRLRAGSLSRNGRQMVRDAQIVIARAHQPDSRVPDSAEKYAAGFIGKDASVRATYFACWCAAFEAGLGHDKSNLLDEVAFIADLKETPSLFINSVLDALSISMEMPIARLAEQADIYQAPLAALFDRLGRASSWPSFPILLWSHLAARLLWENELKAPLQVERMLGLRVDIRDIQPIVPPSGVETIYMRICAGGEILKDRIVPVWGEFTRAEVTEIAMNAVGERTFWRQSSVLMRPRLWPSFLREGVRLIPKAVSILRSREGGRRRRMRVAIEDSKKYGFLRAAGRAASVNGKAQTNLARASAIIEEVRSTIGGSIPVAPPSTPHNAAGNDTAPGFDRQAYWEQFFQTPDPWNYTSPYEQLKYEQTLSLLPNGKLSSALELACAEGHFTQMLAPKVESLIAADISSMALKRAKERCSRFGNIEFRQLDLVDDPLPQDLDLIVCSEVLYFLRNGDQVAEIAQKFHDALKPGGLLLTAHAMVLADDPCHTGFDWENPYGAKTISEAIARIEGLELERSLRTELYRIDLYRRGTPRTTDVEPEIHYADFGRPLDLDVERFVVWGGAVARRETVLTSEATWQVPILMYHRIGEDGPTELSRYRTSPAAFEEQLRLLRRHGFHAITSSDLEAHLRSRQSLPGRPVMITFDDGYQDFYDLAWPILCRNDFTAEVFIVTEKVGTAADWDSGNGASAPLMGWPAIKELHSQGVRFGSHLASHRAASTLPLDALLREAAGSRAVLERQLGCEVASIAPPYGIIDDRLMRCMELSGYRIAFTTEDRVATLFSEHPLFFPRVEVVGGYDLTTFARSIGLELDTNGKDMS